MDRFCQRGYPQWVPDKAVRQVANKERGDSLADKTKTATKDDTVRFITTYNTRHKEVARIKKELADLGSDEVSESILNHRSSIT